MVNKIHDSNLGVDFSHLAVIRPKACRIEGVELPLREVWDLSLNL
jgi:hypothetical protein